MDIEEEVDDDYAAGDEANQPKEDAKNSQKKLSVQIGGKLLSFKIVDKDEAEKFKVPIGEGHRKTTAANNKSNSSTKRIAFDFSRSKQRSRKRGAISNNYTMAPPASRYGHRGAGGGESSGGGGTAGGCAPDRRRSLVDHGAAGSDDAEFNCMFCGCSFESADDLTDHEPACAGGETESMNISCHCGRMFISIDALDSHSKVHEIDLVPPGSANFHCRYCGKSFGTALSLATHEAVHASSMKPFRCNFCNKAFLKKLELNAHERIHVGETPFSCSYCDKMFPTRLKLTRHEILHTGQKPFTCNYCGKTFTHQQSLQKHERAHTGEKPFQCPICTKCFAAQSNYDVHMKLHASGRRFFCSFCGKWFRTEHQMLEHQQNCLAHLHGQSTGDGRPLRYQCSYCEKMFHYRRDQLIHERTHTGERPYTCGYCSKGFTQSQALTIHIRTHTGERPYMCELCGCDFRDSSSLRKHEFIRHPNINPHFVGAIPMPRPLIITQGDEEEQMDFIGLPY